MSITSMMRGIGGEFEIGRTLLTGAGASAIVSPWLFQAWDMFKGAHFDVAAWCTSYPAGIGVLVGSGVFAIGKKEKDVATAKQTQAATDAATASTDRGSAQ